MSNIYNLEPPTKGKVILKTNLGDLEIELWSKEAPKACRNFVQLCMEGYYDGCIFHRVIKDYIAQTGDPTGSGTGGESIYGEAFRDEFHQRLKFTRRGLVACANQNEPHTNGSQFFVTLDKADWLNNRNTIFGRVVGDTVFNLLRFNDLAVDDNDRPMDPPVVLDAEVVHNPFEDLVPRVDKEALKAEAEGRRMAAERAKRAAGRTKNLSLLSFGEEAEEEEAELTAGKGGAGGGQRGGRNKIRSAHDVLEDERLAREQAVAAEELERIAAERPAKRPKAGGPGGEAGGQDAMARLKSAVKQAAGRAMRAGEGGEGRGEEELEAADRAAASAFATSVHAQNQAAREKAGHLPPPPKLAEKPRARSEEPDGDRGGSEEEDEEDGDEGRRGSGRGSGPSGGERDFVAERRAELDAMRAEGNKKSYGRVGGATQVADADLLKPWQLSRERYKARKRAVGDREKDTLARLNKFQSALRSGPVTTAGKDAGKDAAAAAAVKDAPAGGEQAADAAAGADGGYAGKVRSDLDHKSYMPAAWRVDDYLDGPGDEGEEGGDDLASLRQHRFIAVKDKGAMARDMQNLDDYVVVDPLLERNKGKWSAANQREQKRNKEWAGRANV